MPISLTTYAGLVRSFDMKSTVQAELDFPALVKTHHTSVWRYLRLLGCEYAQAEDLTQEVFLAVLNKPFEQYSASSTSAYLRCIARNKFLDLVRRNGREREFDVEAAEQVWQEQQRDDNGETWLESLRSCLAELDGRPKQVLDLRYHEKQPVRKVADRLGMRESGVKTLLGRLKVRLRECVQRKVNQS